MVKKNKVSVADKKKKLYNRIMDEKRITTDQTTIRINKYLSAAGVCSRREADQLTDAGRVTDAGKDIGTGERIPADAEVFLDGRPVKAETRQVLLLFYKPRGIVCSTKKQRQETTVTEFLDYPVRVYPVGRLDRNTTGVLLLTNDGDLASKLTHPKFLKKKIYHVYCDKNVTKADLDQIVQGITLDDGEIHADAISYASDTDKSQVGIEIHSGKNRIVRRIFESLGYRVIKLDRVYFAGLTKKGLRRGDWRYLTEQEVAMLRMGSFE